MNIKKANQALLFSVLSSSLCLISCQGLPQQPTASGNVETSNRQAHNQIPIEKIIKVKTPGVVIARTLPELLEKAEGLEYSNNNFKTLQSLPEDLDKIKLKALPNGNVEISLLTLDQVTYMVIVGEEGQVASFFVAFGDPYQSSGLVQTYGGVLEEPSRAVFEWAPFIISNPNSGSYNPYIPYEPLPPGTYSLLAQSHSYRTETNILRNENNHPFFSNIYEYSSLYNANILKRDFKLTIPHPDEPLAIEKYESQAGPVRKQIFNYPLGGFLEPLDVPPEHNEPFKIITQEVFNGETIEKSEVIFSPKDRNGIYDRIQVTVDVAEDTEWKLMVGAAGQGLSQAFVLTEDEQPIEGVGPSVETWDGFTNGYCLGDAHFELYIVDNEDNILQSETFYVDNTPPALVGADVDVVIEQEETDTQPEIVRNDITLRVEDVAIPVDLPAAGITDEESLNLQVNAESQTFAFSEPADFELLGETNKEFTLQFSVPERFNNRFIHVSFQDDIGNTTNVDLNASEVNVNE